MTASEHDTARRVVQVTANEVRAAQLKLVIDRKRGRDTPEWIQRVAEAKSLPREGR